MSFHKKSAAFARAGNVAALRGDYKRALREWNKSMECELSACAFVNSAIVHFALGNFRKVANFLKNHPAPHLFDKDKVLVGVVAEESRRRIGINRKTGPESNRVELLENAWNLGNELLRSGRWEEAELQFRTVCDEIPDYWESWNSRADQLMRLGDLDRAWACGWIALLSAPNEQNPWCTMGEILLRMKHTRHALVCFEISLRIKPTRELAIYIRSELDRWQAKPK